MRHTKKTASAVACCLDYRVCQNPLPHRDSAAMIGRSQHQCQRVFATRSAQISVIAAPVETLHRNV
ncbi:MAG: hypothetical protein QX190_04650 [Methylococcales bacterium]